MYKFEQNCLDLQLLKIDCNQCDKTFASARSLSNHKSSHDKANVLTCELCGKQFRKDYLTRHKEYCMNLAFERDSVKKN